MSPSRAAFTLIELIISVALGVFMLALVTSALISMRKLSARGQALTAVHVEAANIQRILGDNVQNAHPMGSWGIKLDRGATAAWLNDDGESIALTWLVAMTNRFENSYTFTVDYPNELTWARLVWRYEGVGPVRDPADATRKLLGGRLYFARSSPRRPTIWGTKQVDVYLQPRSDRLRNLNDNDFRFMEGMDQALYWTLNSLPAGSTAEGILGDDADLNDRLQPITGPTTRVLDFSIGWFDRRDHWTGIATTSPTQGLVELDPTGATVAWSSAPAPDPATPWTTPWPWWFHGAAGRHQGIVVSGMLPDGRGDVAQWRDPATGVVTAYDPATSAERRPVMLQVRFTLQYDPYPTDVNNQTANKLSQHFRFSFPVDRVLGRR